MPVRKPAAKKTAAPAKKAAAPAKKTTPAKKSTSASSGLTEEQLKSISKLIVAAIKAGELDYMLVELDDVLTARINKHVAATQKAAPAAKEEKSASPAPKRAASASASKSLDLVANKFYKIGDKPAALKGAKVKYLKPKPGDDKKVVVELAVDKPGYPKGKRVVLPKSAIVAAAR